MRSSSLLLSFWLTPIGLAAQGLPRIAIEQYRLDNGLAVVLAPDRSTQVVTVNVWYDVGSRNEVRGRTGFAHLFEHMMFQGSANVKKGDHFALIERAGGESNASTAEDRTNYFAMLPSNRLNLGLWLEADRMRALAVTAENLDNQREAVKEERRLRVDNQPYTAVIFEGLYGLEDSTRCFPYSHSVIGSMDDLNAAKVEDVQAFFDLYYAPNNASLVVAGDFDPTEAKRMIGEYFGSIPRGKSPPPVSCDFRYDTGSVRRSWPDTKATLPATFQVYRVPPYDHADYPALSLLSTILGQGESSRLNKSVVRTQRKAQFAFTGLNLAGPRRGPGTFFVAAIANQGIAVDSVDAAVAAEIAVLHRTGVTPAELEKAKNGYLAARIQQHQISYFLAESIQEAALFLGDPAAVNTDPERYLAVTAADIRRVAAKYLTPANGGTFIVTPGSGQ
ncbi:MAG: insulinase family protein [Gemmatimonadetes bacterium]|nr:insulinase family protein [Gemmatimonadota bacterium]